MIIVKTRVLNEIRYSDKNEGERRDDGTCGGAVGGGRSGGRWGLGGHDVDDHAHATFAVINGGADEVEQSGPVKPHRAVTVVEANQGLRRVAVVVPPFLHLHHRVILVLKHYTQHIMHIYNKVRTT